MSKPLLSWDLLTDVVAVELVSYLLSLSDVAEIELVSRLLLLSDVAEIELVSGLLLLSDVAEVITFSYIFNWAIFFCIVLIN